MVLWSALDSTTTSQNVLATGFLVWFDGDEFNQAGSRIQAAAAAAAAADAAADAAAAAAAAPGVSSKFT